MRTEFDNHRDKQEYNEAYEKSELYYALFWFWSNWKGYKILQGELRIAWKEYCNLEDKQVKEMLEYINYKDIRKEALRDRFRDKVNAAKEVMMQSKK